MKYIACIALLVSAFLSGCSNQKKLAEDQARFNDAVAAQEAQLDRQIQDATIQNMLMRGAMSEHSAAVFEECREAESKTSTCQKLYARVAKWEKKTDTEYKAQLKADGVTP